MHTVVSVQNKSSRPVVKLVCCLDNDNIVLLLVFALRVPIVGTFSKKYTLNLLDDTLASLFIYQALLTVIVGFGFYSKMTITNT